MKISMLPVSFYKDVQEGKMTIEEWLKICKQTEDLEGADIGMVMFKNFTPKYLHDLKQIVDDVGIPLIMLSCYCDYTNPDALQREREINYMVANASACSQLGIKYIRLIGGQSHPGQKAEDGIRFCTECLLETQKRIEGLGVTIVFENHPGCAGFWMNPDFSHFSDNFLAIYRGIKGSGIKLNIDILNIFTDDNDYKKILDETIDDIVSIHANDAANLPDGTYKPVGCDEGPHILEFFVYLQQKGFDGWVCIEEYTNRGVDGVVKGAKAIRDKWEEAKRINEGLKK